MEFDTDQLQGGDAEQMLSTADSLSSTYQSVGSQSMLFDIMQSKLSENVLPTTTQHIAIG